MNKQYKSTKPAGTVSTKNLLLANKFYRSKVPKFSRKKKIQINVIQTKFRLKYLSRKAGLFTKSLKNTHIQLFNFCFPTEDKFHPNNLCYGNTDFSQFFGLMKFKRVYRVEFNIIDESWTYFLEDRWIRTNLKRFDGSYLETFDFLKNLQDSDASNVQKLLVKWIHHLSNMLIPSFEPPEHDSDDVMSKIPNSRENVLNNEQEDCTIIDLESRG